MKNLLLQYAEYNLWANKRIADILNELPENILNQPFPSSFKSILKTVQQLCFAENLWYKRIKISRIENIPAISLDTTIQQLNYSWLNCSQLWIDLIKYCNENELQKNLDYTSLKGEKFCQPLWQLLQHLFNHQTYHRGQLITLFHLAGISGLPATDFIVFTRQDAHIQ